MSNQSNNFYKLNNRNDFVKFVKTKRDDFDCIEDWENFFGFQLQYDDETESYIETVEEFAQNGYFDNEPTDFPCILYYVISKSFDSLGSIDIEVYDWIPLSDLKRFK